MQWLGEGDQPGGLGRESPYSTHFYTCNLSLRSNSHTLPECVHKCKRNPKRAKNRPCSIYGYIEAVMQTTSAVYQYTIHLCL